MARGQSNEIAQIAVDVDCAPELLLIDMTASGLLVLLNERRPQAVFVLMKQPSLSLTRG